MMWARIKHPTSEYLHLKFFNAKLLNGRESPVKTFVDNVTFLYKNAMKIFRTYKGSGIDAIESCGGWNVLAYLAQRMTIEMSS